jgi:hypothetical protein
LNFKISSKNLEGSTRSLKYRNVIWDETTMGASSTPNTVKLPDPAYRQEGGVSSRLAREQPSA